MEREESRRLLPSRELLLDRNAGKGLVGSSYLTARNLVLDTINIGLGELSQPRVFPRGRHEFGVSEVFAVDFFAARFGSHRFSDLFFINSDSVASVVITVPSTLSQSRTFLCQKCKGTRDTDLFAR